MPETTKPQGLALYISRLDGDPTDSTMHVFSEAGLTEGGALSTLFNIQYPEATGDGNGTPHAYLQAEGYKSILMPVSTLEAIRKEPSFEGMTDADIVFDLHDGGNVDLTEDILMVDIADYTFGADLYNLFL